MLKELIDIWKNRGIMINAVDLFGEMLEDDMYVFLQAWKVFTGELNVKEEKENVYSRDKRINENERKIRRLLVKHLTINPGKDASGCLALMSMVKDAERIGDYSKNIFDIALMTNGASRKYLFKEKIHNVQGNIVKSLSMLKETFINSDGEKAKDIMQRYKEVKKECTAILKDLFEQDAPRNETLVTVVLLQYLKRINSHITNVASGIVLPIDQIDFVKGGLLE